MSIQEQTQVDEGAVITLTDTAVTKVKELISQESEENLALRVAVRPGGCSGFSYEMFFDSDVAADDITNDFGGVSVVVDPSSAPLLKGATLDFKDGLQGAGFSINNPITTVDGLAEPERSAWADAFCATGASQCGFCTPGIILRLAALRAKGSADVDGALLAHLCRCTGWRTIGEAFAAYGVENGPRDLA